MKKITSIILSLLLLLSSTQVSYALHICHGEIVKSEVSLGATNLSCGMVSPKNDCETESKGENSLSRKCCDNRQFSVETYDDFQTITKVEFKAVTLKMPPLFGFVLPIQGLDQKFGFSGLSPPKVVHDFQIDFQTFLI